MDSLSVLVKGAIITAVCEMLDISDARDVISEHSAEEAERTFTSALADVLSQHSEQDADAMLRERLLDTIRVMVVEVTQEGSEEAESHGEETGN